MTDSCKLEVKINCSEASMSLPYYSHIHMHTHTHREADLWWLSVLSTVGKWHSAHLYARENLHTSLVCLHAGSTCGPEYRQTEYEVTAFGSCTGGCASVVSVPGTPTCAWHSSHYIANCCMLHLTSLICWWCHGFAHMSRNQPTCCKQYIALSTQPVSFL